MKNDKTENIKPEDFISDTTHTQEETGIIVVNAQGELLVDNTPSTNSQSPSDDDTKDEVEHSKE